MNQAALAFDPPESIVDREFAAYCATPHGRALEAEIVLRARRLKARGFSSYGIAALFEAIRYDRSVDLGPTCEEWKCNNNHRAGLARKIMREHSDLAGFFSTREQTGRTWRKGLRPSTVRGGRPDQGAPGFASTRGEEPLKN